MKKLIVLVLKYILLLFFLVVLKQALSSVSYCYSLGQLSRDNPKSTSLKTQKIYVDVNKNSTFRQLQFCDWFQREQLPYAIAFIFLQFFLSPESVFKVFIQLYVQSSMIIQMRGREVTYLFNTTKPFPQTFVPWRRGEHKDGWR